MSKVKSPRQKKSKSLLKDRRNTYGESCFLPQEHQEGKATHATGIAACGV
jgi:hypothetical protein